MATRHGMTPTNTGRRGDWRRNYPMVAPNYSAARSESRTNEGRRPASSF
ncbi:MucR family transcriptional regulator [Mesorhizobium sp. CA12]|nr:MucR family transcriptional regulator [Mesorhizobium sp. CA12]